MRLQKNQFLFRFRTTWLATVIYVKINTNTLVVKVFYCVFRTLYLLAWKKNLSGRGCEIEGRLLECFAIFTYPLIGVL